jgi:hypothetical protein
MRGADLVEPAEDVVVPLEPPDGLVDGEAGPRRRGVAADAGQRWDPPIIDLAWLRDDVSPPSVLPAGREP